jgi:hypothetical protein
LVLKPPFPPRYAVSVVTPAPEKTELAPAPPIVTAYAVELAKTGVDPIKTPPAPPAPPAPLPPPATMRYSIDNFCVGAIVVKVPSPVKVWITVLEAKVTVPPVNN